MNRKDFQDLVRMSEASRKSLISQLKRQAAESEHADGAKDTRRKDQRWDYVQTDLAVTVEHPGGSISRFLVMPRNLSAGGIAFLHGGYLHQATRCTIQLPRLGGPIDTVTGVVTNCRHVDGRMHEVSIKFDRRIDPLAYFNLNAGGEGSAGASIELPDLRGSVLHIEDSEADNRLLAHHLRSSGIQLKSAADCAGALKAMAAEPFDIVLCDLNLGSEPGEAVMQTIRNSGFTGPIVALSADCSEARMKAAKLAGATEFLAKPYKPVELYSLMMNLHQAVGAILKREALFSTMPEQSGSTELIDGYIQQAHTIGRKIKESVVANDVGALRNLCLNLKGTAGGYGFEALSAAAGETIKALDANPTIQDATRQVRALRLLCENVAKRPMKGHHKGGHPPKPQ